jgi:hypothetical protein
MSGSDSDMAVSSPHLEKTVINSEAEPLDFRIEKHSPKWRVT